MSRNATALKPTIARRPVRRLQSVTPPRDIPEEIPQFSDRVQTLKNLALTLLKEAQALESDRMMSELALPLNVGPLDIAGGIKLDEAVGHFESNLIQQALLITGGNQARAARLLGVKANTLNYKIKIYNL